VCDCANRCLRADLDAINAQQPAEQSRPDRHVLNEPQCGLGLAACPQHATKRAEHKARAGIGV
jgi:hypothetical protein